LVVIAAHDGDKPVRSASAPPPKLKLGLRVVAAPSPAEAVAGLLEASGAPVAR